MESEEKRCSFSAYYDALQIRDGVVAPRPLIADWDAALAKALFARVREGSETAKLIGAVVPNLVVTSAGRARSNQSRGNVLADYISAELNKLDTLHLTSLRGHGYPDRRLEMVDPDFVCAVEFKATSEWKDSDGNRRVLTSSASKIISAIDAGLLPDPPCHLLVTALYDDDSGVLNNLRLDCLQPDSTVAVRLEASTSHALLRKNEQSDMI